MMQNKHLNLMQQYNKGQSHFSYVSHISLNVFLWSSLSISVYFLSTYICCVGQLIGLKLELLHSENTNKPFRRMQLVSIFQLVLFWMVFGSCTAGQEMRMVIVKRLVSAYPFSGSTLYHNTINLKKKKKQMRVLHYSSALSMHK